MRGRSVGNDHKLLSRSSREGLLSRRWYENFLPFSFCCVVSFVLLTEFFSFFSISSPSRFFLFFPPCFYFFSVFEIVRNRAHSSEDDPGEMNFYVIAENLKSTYDDVSIRELSLVACACNPPYIVDLCILLMCREFPVYPARSSASAAAFIIQKSSICLYSFSSVFDAIKLAEFNNGQPSKITLACEVRSTTILSFF